MVRPRSTRGKVFSLQIVPPEQANMFRSDLEHVVAAIAPGRRTTRYGREWIIGQTSLNTGVLTGRIGFRGAEGLAEIWDESRQDFKAIAVPAGLTAPFGIRLRDLRMMTQPRGSVIKLNSLIGAFEALLNEEDSGWKITGDRHLVSFGTWRQSVDKVISVRARVRRPNPHYRDTPDLEAIMDQTEAETVSLEARSDDGIDIDSPFLAQTHVHAEAGYGEIRYVGIRHSKTSYESETVYSTVLSGEEESIDAPVDVESGEVDPETLRSALESDDPSGDTEADDEQHE